MPSPVNYFRPARSLIAGLILACSAGFATAQDLSYSASCIQGFVDSADYAELTADFKEFGWDSRGSLKLNSVDDALTLIVLDQNNIAVCDNVADLRTQCAWTLSPGGIYTVRIDNTTRPTQSSYSLCAN